MSSAPLVSVIVPTYKRPDFLKKTIQSILDQSYRNIELIVISNGVNPDNESVVKEFNDSRLTYADQENTGGPSAPRNHGIRLAKGAYIAVCDDDDLWLPDKLEKQIQALESDNDAGLCYTNVISFDDSGREWSDERYLTNFDVMRLKNAVPISSVLVRTNLIQAVGGFEESKIVGDSEDYEFVLRCAANANFSYVDEKLVKYWAGTNRTTSTDEERTIADAWAHFTDVMGCHWCVIKKTDVSPFKFILPAFYHFGIFAKTAVYLICKKVGLK